MVLIGRAVKTAAVLLGQESETVATIEKIVLVGHAEAVTAAVTTAPTDLAVPAAARPMGE